MTFRKASASDHESLKEFYRTAAIKMQRDGMRIWNELFPSEFIGGDIENGRIYMLIDGSEIVAAFALYREYPAAQAVKWENDGAEAVYLGKFAVNAARARTGIGQVMIGHAFEQAGKTGAEYLRLFVVDTNLPAIAFYEKVGFLRAEGEYLDKIPNDMILREFGYEKRV